MANRWVKFNRDDENLRRRWRGAWWRFVLSPLALGVTLCIVIGDGSSVFAQQTPPAGAAPSGEAAADNKLAEVSADATDAASGGTAEGSELQLPITSRAGSGHLLPASLGVTNSSDRDAASIRFTTNQLVTVELATLLPAGERRQIELGLWYWGGPLQFLDVALLTGDGNRIVSLGDLATEVEAVSPESRLVLIDRRLGAPPAAAAALERLRQNSDELRGLVSGEDARRPLLVEMADMSAGQSLPLLPGSQVAALVVAESADNLPELSRAAELAMLPLWTVSSQGELVRHVDGPALLGDVLRSGALRPDLFDRSIQAQPSRIPQQLFRLPQWSLGERLRLLLPVLIAAPLLAALALVGRLMPLRRRLAAMAVVLAVAAMWTVALTRSSAMGVVQTLTVEFGDATDGRRVRRDFAMLAVRRLKEISVRPSAAGLPPRPQLWSADHRIDYRGTSIHRDSDGRWSLHNMAMEPNRLLLFAFDSPHVPQERLTAPPVRLTVSGSDNQPRLSLSDSLKDVYVMMDGRAWHYGEVAEGRDYRPLGPSQSIRTAAYTAAPEAERLHLRAVQWIGRQWYRRDLVLVFGWQTTGDGMEVEGAKHRELGRLMIWALPRAKVDEPGS